jgi:ABC-type Zn uptake system ZnuABC Zn-binding protein ZnuA
MTLVGLGALLGVATACGDGMSSSQEGPDGDRLRIVTTVAPITSITSNVVGDRADVVGIVPEGTNSHTFEPPPSVAEALAQADVVLLNGLKLEEPTARLAQDVARSDAEIVELGNRTIAEDDYLYDFSFPRSGGKPNPHLWTDPTLAKRYAATIRDVVSERDPANADEYASNYTAFAVKVDALDRAMRTSFATIPADQRKLLTYHDAYAYFAQTYDFEVIGAIQPSDFAEPSARDVADLVAQVDATDVPAIFGSEVFPSPVLEQIGREAGVRYVDTLRDDDLPGEPGDADHSWLGLMRFDYATMTEALGGDASALDALATDDVAVDAAEYPQ